MFWGRLSFFQMCIDLFECFKQWYKAIFCVCHTGGFNGVITLKTLLVFVWFVWQDPKHLLVPNSGQGAGGTLPRKRSRERRISAALNPKKMWEEVRYTRSDVFLRVWPKPMEVSSIQWEKRGRVCGGLSGISSCVTKVAIICFGSYQSYVFKFLFGYAKVKARKRVWIRWSDQVFFVTQICVVLSWKSEGLIVQCMLIACYNVLVALFCIFLSSIVALSWLFKHRQHIQQLLVTYNFDTEQCRLTKQMWLTLWMSDLVFLFHIFGVMTPDW